MPLKHLQMGVSFLTVYRPVDDEENLSGECDLGGNGEQALEQSGQ